MLLTDGLSGTMSMRAYVFLSMCLLGALRVPGFGQPSASTGSFVLDPGYGTVQVAADGDLIYILKASGEIWGRSNIQGWQRINVVPEARMIAAGGGKLYVLLTSGNIFLRNGPNLTLIDPGKATRQITSDPHGSLYILKERGNIWRYSSGSFQQLSPESNTVQISASSMQVLARLSNGNVYRLVDGTRPRWEMVDDGTGTAQVEADSTLLYVLKESGEIWRSNTSPWQKISEGAGIQQISGTYGYLHALTRSGEIWRWADEHWSRMGAFPRVRQIAAMGSDVLALLENGNLYLIRGRPGTTPWNPAESFAGRGRGAGARGSAQVNASAGDPRPAGGRIP